MRKIVIIGSTLSGNKGAAAMLESSIQTIGEVYSDVQFSLLSYIKPEIENKQNNYSNLKVLRATPLYLGVVINSLALFYAILPPLRPLLRKNKQINALAEADVFLDQGGITFVDGREKFLIYNIASILPALLMKCPVVKCSQAMGPFNNPINRLMAKIFLPKIKVIFARGSITRKNLKKLKLKNVILSADYAFLLDLKKSEKKSAEKYYNPDFFKKCEVVGISPSVVMDKKASARGVSYDAVITEFINDLISKGYRVALIPHSARAGTEKTHNNDLPLCRKIYENVSNKKDCLFINEELSSQELRSIIGKCSFFVASRFHAMVSSLAMGVPTLVIGWSHKYKEVLEMFELEEWAFGLDKLSLDYLKSRFEDLQKDETITRKKLEKNLPAVKKKAQKQVDKIAEILAD